jgi:hypothetical protein
MRQFSKNMFLLKYRILRKRKVLNFMVVIKL